MTRFLVGFLGLLILGFTGLHLPAVQSGVVEPFARVLAQISGLLLTALDANVYSQGAVLGSSTGGFAVEVRSGCDGLDVMLMLIAGIIMFPAFWGRRALGILAGLSTIMVMNIGRIVTLFWLGQWNMTVFQFAHEFLWPALIVLDALIIFLVWVHFSGYGRAAAQ